MTTDQLYYVRWSKNGASGTNGEDLTRDEAEARVETMLEEDPECGATVELMPKD